MFRPLCLPKTIDLKNRGLCANGKLEYARMRAELVWVLFRVSGSKKVEEKLLPTGCFITTATFMKYATTYFIQHNHEGN